MIVADGSLEAQPPGEWPHNTITMWLAFVAVALLVVGGLALIVHRWRTRDRRALAAALEERLAAALPAGTASHLEASPTVRDLAVVDRVDDGAESVPVYVPVVRVDLGMADTPRTAFALEYVADVLTAIHPYLRERDERVRSYDVEFRFGPDGLLVSGECRRVTVPPELADRLVDDDGYRAFDLHRDVAQHDESPGPATLWTSCRNH